MAVELDRAIAEAESAAADYEDALPGPSLAQGGRVVAALRELLRRVES